MRQSDLFRENAENCLHLAERAEAEPAYKRYIRMAEGWTALAQEQDWLDGEMNPTSDLGMTRAGQKTLAD